MVRQMFNGELFLKYRPELRLKIHNQINLKTGMRRNELAGLKVRDVHSDFLMVIQGKGRNDRVIPLLPDIQPNLFVPFRVHTGLHTYS